MRRYSSAPTHGWVISSKLTRYLASAFVILLLFIFVASWTIAYSIRRDCTDVYKRRFKAFGYWLNVESGSTKSECPQHDY